MISFFFATMVALTFSGTRPNSSTIINTSADYTSVFDENNNFIGYDLDDSNNDEPCYYQLNGTIYNKRDYYFHTGLGDIDFRLETNYVSANGGNGGYVDFKFTPITNSVSTNIYLTSCNFEFVQGSYTTVINIPDIYFRGQPVYFDTGDMGYDIDNPYTLVNTSFWFNFSIRCYSILDAQTNWYNDGYNDGYNAGNTVGTENGYNIGYSVGYQDGYNQGYSTDSTVTSIFSGILQVALVPINFFLACFNFEILGINLKGFIQALFTIAITVIVIKTIFGGKGASDS